ncbi:MAG: glycosyltransferase family 2 protein [Geobacteraceae bacterium]|nr:glycosyltransferase family 2 protein [Geobacteraceae bacterium]
MSINLDAFPLQRIFFAIMKPEPFDTRNNAAEPRNSGLTLSIVVPAYNESENLNDAIRMIASGIPCSVSDHEIIIIDDGSRDATAEIIHGLVASNRKIRGIFHDVNRGKGAALSSGFREARMEWVLFTDADLQIQISELPAFLDRTGDRDIIIGYRLGRRDPFSRKLFSRIYTAIIRFALGFAVRDINCPFKLIRRSFLDSCDLRSRGFFIDTELMHTAFGNKLRIEELGVACQPRQHGESTVRFRHVTETVRELFELMNRRPAP